MTPTDRVARQIINSAISVHKKFGPGLLESVYAVCLGQELLESGLEVEIGKPLSLDHQGLHLNRAFVLDLLVENSVIVEVKSVTHMNAYKGHPHRPASYLSPSYRHEPRADPELQRYGAEERDLEESLTITLTTRETGCEAVRSLDIVRAVRRPTGRKLVSRRSRTSSRPWCAWR
jgi:GxxExxY protein